MLFRSADKSSFMNRRNRLKVERLEQRDVPSSAPVSADPVPAGQSPEIVVRDAEGVVITTITAYESGFTGGVRVAVADVTGDGVPDVVTAPGPGGGPRVRVFDGTDFAVADDYFAYDPGFRGGVSVAAGPIGGGVTGVATGAGEGGGPRVRVFDAAGVVADFMAGDPEGRDGVRVSLASRPDGSAVVTTRGDGWSARFDASTGLVTEASPFGNFERGSNSSALSGQYEFWSSSDLVDINGDGIADGVGIDTDGDGVFDGVDLNGDGIIDGEGVDADGDGVFDGIDSNGDGVGDGVGPGGFGYDRDGDGVVDGVGYDLNGDGVIDGVGLDTTGDEIIEGIDLNGDGTVDGIGYDLNGDGLPDSIGIDADGDGVLDAIDADGDGITDGYGLDVNGDGAVDSIGLDGDADGQPDGADVDGDGVSDGVVVDTDGDGVQDGVAVDTDGDGEPDLVVSDTNGDGAIDSADGETSEEEPQGGGGAAKPFIAVSADPARVREGETSKVTFTRTGGDLTTALTVPFTMGGTASWGADYTPPPVSVTFGANVKQVTVDLVTLADNVVDPYEVVRIIVTPGASYDTDVSPAGNADFAILDVGANLVLKMGGFIPGLRLGQWLPEPDNALNPGGRDEDYETNMRGFGGDINNSKVFSVMGINTGKIGNMALSDLQAVIGGQVTNASISTRRYKNAAGAWAYESKQATLGTNDLVIMINSTIGGKPMTQFKLSAEGSYPFPALAAGVAAPNSAVPDVSYGLLMELKLVSSTATTDTVEISGSYYTNGFPDYEVYANTRAVVQKKTPFTGPGLNGLTFTVFQGRIERVQIVVPK